ncbi:MarR family winged helix-turn-helix transcriptional regulator [Streptomyces fungicidicus]|jgi:DNA-binding MarR family transcriptional regulator|uniref:MarR family transcriptional regulator n=2 Tax=Streptomyces TaxID=1883 RepID=A0A494V8Y6_9ACTN|nr:MULTISPECIES: MarR family transcriptional regulator [Streptomyces]AYL40121.1 MarR family transcriptional regulator [Streptomyces fungicidicus]EFL37623.1 MarR-family transcriptional regulator [Streptomyces griseoflavus Tu4000]QKW04064.1 MarR family transcriptional regulator [Streptomyces sp. NA02536]TQL18553.1 DNA-binding MarR family transcriptional regulator [Streptomyces sp. SLBN-134]
MSTPPVPDAPAAAEVAEIERALHRITYLSTRARQHERLMALAGVPLDRAAVALMRKMADAEPMRPGELAARMGVEASHVTRTVQQLQKSGHVTRVPDPDDRRAQRIELTDAGREAIVRVREAGVRGMQVALADWSPDDLRQLATLFHRMVDDFFAHSSDEEPEPTRTP